MGTGASTTLVRDEVVAADVSCSACGYNLRTLSVEARCPECGESIADSVSATLYEMQGTSRKYWLGENRSAMQLLGAAGGLVGIVLLVLPWVRQPESWPRDVSLMMLVIAWTLQWVAVWKLSAPLEKERLIYRRARWVARFGSTVLLFVPLCFGVAGIIEYWAPVNGRLIRVLMSGGAVVGLIGWLAVSVLLVRLAATIGRPRLAGFVAVAAVFHLIAGGLSTGGLRTMAVTKPVGTSMDVMLILIHPLLGSPMLTRQLALEPFYPIFAPGWPERLLAIDQLLLLAMWLLLARATLRTPSTV